MVLPPQKLYIETIRRVKRIARKIAGALKINGPFNIQFIAKNNDVKVIECNLRASRSFPFVSKVLKHNFIDMATRIIMKQPVEAVQSALLDIDYVGIKAPQFSFSRLRGADPILNVEMASTGEVACIGDDAQEALLKSIISTGIELPKSSLLVSVSGEANRLEILEGIRSLYTKGFKIYATESTSKFLASNGIKNTMLYKIHEQKKPNTLDYLKEDKLDMVINVPDQAPEELENVEIDDDYTIRRMTVDFSVPLLTNIQLTKAFLDALNEKQPKDLAIKSWDEYD